MSIKLVVGTLAVAFGFCYLGAAVYSLSHPAINPPVQLQSALEANFPIPPQLAGSLRRACGDCHSNETRWPWYSKIPPMSLLLARDVNMGRQSMNFSEWSGKSPAFGAGILMAGCVDVQSGRMPPAGYRMLHPESNLSPRETEALCQWSRVESRRVFAMKRTNRSGKN